MEGLSVANRKYTLISERAARAGHSGRTSQGYSDMAFFDRFRTNVERLQQEKDYAGLAAALDAEDPGIRADAARSLVALGVPAIPDLLNALEGARPASRTRMTEALALAGISAIPLLLAVILRAGPALQASIARAVAGAGGGMIDALLPALHHEQPAIRRAAVIALRETGRRSTPHLVKMLHDKNPQVRREVAGALAAQRWAPDDPGEKVWFCYLRGDWGELAKLQSAAVPILLEALGSSETPVRCDAARTLGKIRDGRAIPPLVRALRDPAIDVRICSIEALGEMGDDRAKPPLVEALNDPNHRVRMEAAWSLKRLGWVPHSDLARAEYLIAGERWSDLIKMGRVAIPPLIRALDVEYSGVRTGASEALRQLGQPALGALNMEMASKDPARQKRAQIALEYIRQRQKDATRAQPAPEVSTRYAQELKEGLAIQRRFSKQFGRSGSAPVVPAKSPPPKKEEPPAPESPGKPSEKAEEKPEKAVSLKDLIAESRQAEEAWAQVKAGFRMEMPDPTGSIPLEDLIPIEFEEAIAVAAKEAAEEPARAERKPQEMDIPELPKVAPEPVAAEPAPEKTSLELYIEALRSGDPNIRAAAVAALQAMGKEAVAYLIEALKDPYYGVRIAAAEALGEIKDKSAVDALILLCADAREDVRIAAACALGSIGDHRSIRPLIRLFKDNYHGVRVAASDAAATFGRNALGPLEEAFDDPVPAIRMTAAKAIGTIGAGESVPALIEHLGDPAPEVRWSIARALAGFGPLAVEPLFLVLKRGKKDMRLAAIDALWEVPGERADEALIYASSDEDGDVRERATAALRKRHVINVWRLALGTQIREEESTRRTGRSTHLEDEKAFEASGQQEIDSLIVALKDKAWNAQLGTATRLIMMGRPAVDGLIRALRNENPEIQTAAAGLLGEMRETAVAPLMDALDDSDRFVRLVAARNLGKIGNKRAIEALIASLHREPDSEVRATVAEALGYMGSRQAIEPLALALQDRDEAVKIAAARSLGYMGDNRALEPLILALSDVDGRVRHAALEALKDSGDKVRALLVGALRSGDGTLRAGAAEALSLSGWTPKTGEEEALYLIARDQWAGVERIGADALPAVIGALSDPSIEIRTNAIRAIARIGGEGSVAPLIRALDDDALAVRKRAEQALVDMGSEVLPALTLAAGKRRPEARENLARIIDEIRRKEA